jgi:hypothetical protein
LDSKFCKRCGAEIPADELAEGQAKLDRLIEEGNSLFNQARIEEALAVADAAVASNPSSVSALSLKALCHERRGEIAEALEVADRIVELNPDSDFDRIRRSALRQKLQAEYHLADVPDRRVAVLGAVGAIVLVVCTGVFFAHMLNTATPRAADTSVVASNQALGAPVTSLTSPMTTGPSGGTGAGGQAPSSTGGDNATVHDDKIANDDGADRTQADPGRVPPLRSRGRNDEPPTGIAPDSPLPQVNGGTLGVPPVSPQVDLTQVAPTANNHAGDDNVEPAPKPGPSPTSPPPSTPDDSVIEIKTHPSAGGATRKVFSGSQSGPTISGTGLQALLRVGSQQFELGNYEAAARSYEQAIQNGGDSIVLNRRLGQAYQRLGRSSDAAEAYRKCISAVDSALASGRGSRESLMSTRDVCQQELKVLGG